LGSLNPRDTNSDDFFNNLVDKNGFNDISDKASSINQYINYLSLNQNRGTISVCTLYQSEIDTLFGSTTKKLQWISRDERNKMQTDSAKNQAFTFNKRLPHYQYAYALFKESN
jgi:hypothetical protein